MRQSHLGFRDLQYLHPTGELTPVSALSEPVGRQRLPSQRLRLRRDDWLSGLDAQEVCSAGSNDILGGIKLGKHSIESSCRDELVIGRV